MGHDGISGTYTGSRFSAKVRWPGIPPEFQGRVAIRDIFIDYPSEFPDARNRNERAASDEDCVCAEYLFTGAHMVDLSRVLTES